MNEPCRARLVRCAAALFLLGGASVSAFAAPDSTASADPGLQVFKAWLDRTYPHYGCDEGPVALTSSTVAAAYPRKHFYYVLTRARGIQPPFPNALTLVAEVDENGKVRRLSSIDDYGVGLVKVSSVKQAKLASAAVLILSLSAPSSSRGKFDPSKIEAKKGRKGWTCDYTVDDDYTSHVRFDRQGRLTAMEVNTPPVP